MHIAGVALVAHWPNVALRVAYFFTCLFRYLGTYLRSCLDN